MWKSRFSEERRLKTLVAELTLDVRGVRSAARLRPFVANAGLAFCESPGRRDGARRKLAIDRRPDRDRVD